MFCVFRANLDVCEREVHFFATLCYGNVLTSYNPRGKNSLRGGNSQEMLLPFKKVLHIELMLH